MPAIIRYPGSKAKLVGAIRQSLPGWMVGSLWTPPRGAEYVEPFFGSGAFGLEVLEHVDPSVGVWINDIDIGVCAMWKSVVSHTRELVRLVRSFEPSVDEFFRLKEEDGRSTGSAPLDGFNKIALHRMSMSGFGSMSGGPIGGKAQSGAYTVGCRWTPASIEQAIYNAKETLSRFSSLRITNHHVRDVIPACGESSLIYLDPPYYVKGGELYANNMDDSEHYELSQLLKVTDAAWRLSYDDCPRIRELYSWAGFRELDVRYTNAVTDKKRPKNMELLIFPLGSSHA